MDLCLHKWEGIQTNIMADNIEVRKHFPEGVFGIGHIFDLNRIE